MKALIFGKRCGAEILRDPLTVIFGLGFPIVLLLLLSAIQANIPVELFEIRRLAPGISVFGLSFVTLFAASLIARDRESSFLQRLYTTPMKPTDFILGYMLPMLPIAAVQCALCFAFAIVLGLPVSIKLVLAVIAILPASVMYISLGLLFGSILNVKQVGGICGALLTNLSAWLSGVWFDLELVGGTFEKIANLLPFSHAVELERAVVSGNYGNVICHLLPVLAYSAAALAGAIFLFLRQMKKQ